MRAHVRLPVRAPLRIWRGSGEANCVLRHGGLGGVEAVARPTEVGSGRPFQSAAARIRPRFECMGQVDSGTHTSAPRTRLVAAVRLRPRIESAGLFNFTAVRLRPRLALQRSAYLLPPQQYWLISCFVRLRFVARHGRCLAQPPRGRRGADVGAEWSTSGCAGRGRVFAPVT